MTAGTQVVLDACVLVNAALRDTLLRIAEPPRLYLPRWSKDILEETTRTLEIRLGLSSLQTSHLVAELKRRFADCWIAGYEAYIPSVTNDAKDRHVLAAEDGKRLALDEQGGSDPHGGRDLDQLLGGARLQLEEQFEVAPAVVRSH